MGNRSRNGSRGGSECRSGPGFRRESGREIRRVSACSSRVEFHVDSEVDMREDLRNLCRGDLKDLLLGVSRFDSQIGFHLGLHGDSYRDLRGESRGVPRLRKRGGSKAPAVRTSGLGHDPKLPGSFGHVPRLGYILMKVLPLALHTEHWSGAESYTVLPQMGQT